MLEVADETQYWLELLEGSKAISAEEFETVFKEAFELTAIFTASFMTARKKKK